MIKIKWVRIAAGLLIIAIILSGTAFRSEIGTLCSLIVSGIPFTCPLGFLQAALANRNLLPQVWLPAGLVVLSVLVLGRVFCAWICPAALLRQVFGSKSGANSHAGDQRNNLPTHSHDPSPEKAGPANGAFKQEKPPFSYSGYAVLAGALLSSFLFGFPVFCVICPVGLFFGTLLAVNRLVFVKQPSLELLILPAILGLELFALRSWCTSLCPLGALLGIIARFNRSLRLKVDPERCLTFQGIGCRACERACPYGFNLSKEHASATLNACAKCFECYENCPTKAIRFGLAK